MARRWREKERPERAYCKRLMGSRCKAAGGSQEAAREEERWPLQPGDERCSCEGHGGLPQSSVRATFRWRLGQNIL